MRYVSTPIQCGWDYSWTSLHYEALRDPRREIPARHRSLRCDITQNLRSQWDAEGEPEDKNNAFPILVGRKTSRVKKYISTGHGPGVSRCCDQRSGLKGPFHEQHLLMHKVWVCSTLPLVQIWVGTRKEGNLSQRRIVSEIDREVPYNAHWNWHTDPFLAANEPTLINILNM